MRLQPYRQSSFKKKWANKLKHHFYGPYKIIGKVGEVAYELEILEKSKIHNVFHVSSLKKIVGKHITPSTKLPPLDDGLLVLILQVRERKLRNMVIREYLVKWKEFPIEDATWEGKHVLQHPNLQLLEYKQFQAGRTVMSSSK